MIDDVRALEHGEEPARRLPRRARELRQLRLCRGDQHVLLTSALLTGGGDQLQQDGGHPALHGLERLAGQPLVRLPQTTAESDDQLHGDIGVLTQQAAHVRAENRDDLRRLDGLDRRRASLVVEHRQLSEDVARPEVGQRDRPPIAIAPEGAQLTRPHDVTRVAVVALVEDDLARPILPGHRDLGDARELGVAQRLERGDVVEQRDRVASC